MSNTNFFGWIREGVKESVIRGVGDAIEQLGTPEDDNESTPQVLAFLRADNATPRMAISDAVTSTGTPNRSRRRLGKSLKEIDSTPS